MLFPESLLTIMLSLLCARLGYTMPGKRRGPPTLAFLRVDVQHAVELFCPYHEFARQLTQVARVAKLLAIAKKPMLYVGQGALDCAPLLRAIAKKANVPVTTTLHAMGCFDEHDPLSMHMLGMHGAAYANYAIQESDLIVAIGSRFDDRTTGVLGKYAPEARKAHEEGRGGLVHFDIEPTQFGRVINPTVAVAGDCALSLAMLEPLVEWR